MKLLPRSGAVGEEREESGEGAYSWVCKCCCVNAARGIHSLRNYAAALNTSSFLRQCVWSSEPGQSEMFVFPFFSAATWTLVALFSSLCYLWVLHCLLHLPSDTLMSLTLCYDTCTRRITLQDTFLFFSLLFFNQQQKNKTGTASGLIGSSNVWGSQDRDLGRLLELFTTLKRYSRGINCLLNWLMDGFSFFLSVFSSCFHDDSEVLVDSLSRVTPRHVSSCVWRWHSFVIWRIWFALFRGFIGSTARAKPSTGTCGGESLLPPYIWCGLLFNSKLWWTHYGIKGAILCRWREYFQ